MWDGLFVLLLLCLVMGGASFAAGILPLTLTLSPRQLRLITALGTGVLVGTALIVIIPEGVETLYSSALVGHTHSTRAVTGLARDDSPPTGHDSQDVTPHNPHAWIGISLITGFLLMYLIDTLPAHLTASSRRQSLHFNLHQFNLSNPSTDVPETPTDPSFATLSRPSSTTVGLVIHAFADGIALGASSTTTSRLSFIIFFALMIHKAPAAFGLTSVLLKQGLSKRAARTNLIAFSAAAPVGALATFAAAHILGYGEGDSTEFATGVLLVFSGGTFLYVATHALREVGESKGHDEVPMGMFGESAAAPMREEENAGVLDVGVVVVGMLVPMLTQFGHGH